MGCLKCIAIEGWIEAYACHAGADIINGVPGRRPAHQCARLDEYPCSLRHRRVCMTKVVPVVPELRLTVMRAVGTRGVGLDAQQFTSAVSRERSAGLPCCISGSLAKVVERAELSWIETGRGEALAVERQFVEREAQRAFELSRPPSLERRGRKPIKVVERFCARRSQHSTRCARGSDGQPPLISVARPISKRIAGHTCAKRVVIATCPDDRRFRSILAVQMKRATARAFTCKSETPHRNAGCARP